MLRSFGKGIIQRLSAIRFEVQFQIFKCQIFKFINPYNYELKNTDYHYPQSSFILGLNHKIRSVCMRGQSYLRSYLVLRMHPYCSTLFFGRLDGVIQAVGFRRTVVHSRICTMFRRWNLISLSQCFHVVLDFYFRYNWWFCVIYHIAVYYKVTNTVAQQPTGVVKRD